MGGVKPVAASPVPFEVRWCAFPQEEAPNQPGPKDRPVAVLAFAAEQNLVRVAYGTSQIRTLRAWHLLVTPAQLRGLTKPTVFDFSRLLSLPHQDQYFPAVDGVNVIGTLSAQLQAEAVECFKCGSVERQRLAARTR